MTIADLHAAYAVFIITAALIVAGMYAIKGMNNGKHH